MNWWLFIGGLVVHLIFFYSIFDVYFSSPLVHGMLPQQPMSIAPADRLVLFVADGLRADKLYQVLPTGESRAPFLRHQMMKEGSWGVSHTRVPTESRPGHVAVIAGFYEDVSAVAKGWKENPVEFDSLFNESRHTWSWGSPDILPMFSKGASEEKVSTRMYPPEYEDFAGTNLSRLDTWVFNEVETFLADAKSNAKLMEELNNDRIVFFLHLLGLDTNGHRHRPYSQEYLDNIRVVDEGVRSVVNQIEEFYRHDKRTAYVFTSDHGMTDWGSHGAGLPSETLTPLIAWGAGVRNSALSPTSTTEYRDNFLNEWNLTGQSRFDVNQADICPLMATLIGVPIPLQSVGVIPLDYIDGSDEQRALSMFTNSKQVLAQFEIKMREKKTGTFSYFFTAFKPLTPDKQIDAVRQIQSLLREGKFVEVIERSRELIELALEGLTYYHRYDRIFLGASIAAGFIGWMAYVVSELLIHHTDVVKVSHSLRNGGNVCASSKLMRYIFVLFSLSLVAFLSVQSRPWSYIIYALLPTLLWYKVMQRFEIFQASFWYIINKRLTSMFIMSAGLSILGLEILIGSFFYREILSLGLLVMAAWSFLGTSKSITSSNHRAGWTLSCLVLAVFPLLPVVGRDANYIYVYVSGTVGILLSLFCNSGLGSSVVQINKLSRISLGTTFFKWLHILIILLSVLIVYNTSSSLHSRNDLSTLSQAGSWTILGSSFILPTLSSSRVYPRLVTIGLAFLAPYLLLSTSYEALFYVVLSIALFYWLQMEANQSLNTPVKLENLDFCESASIGVSHRHLMVTDLRSAYFFIFFLLCAFFGTGNIASINSFDPTSVLCFVSVFNPFVMGALMLCKILIPFLLVTCAFSAIHLSVNVQTQSLFLVVLLMSDFMALHFFFLIKDYGSWLDIGMSISNYVIVMAMISFLFGLLSLSKIFTNFSLIKSQQSTTRSHQQ